MGACNIFKTKDFYKVITESETEDGFLLCGNPVFLVQLNDFIGLQNALFESLNSSRTNVPTPRPQQYPILEKEIMEKIREKSYTSLYKTSFRASVRFEKSGILKMWPLKFFNPAKPSEGLVLVDEGMIEIQDAKDKKEEVTSKIIEILNQKF